MILAILGRHEPAAWVSSATAYQAVALQPAATTHRFYFGGGLVRGTGQSVNLGRRAAAGFIASIFSAADGPSIPVPSCLVAAPPSVPSTRFPKNISADLPGLYGAPWVARINDNLVAALHVNVPRNADWQPASPTLQIYRHGAATAAFSQTVPVSVIRGSQALLYRIFVDGPIRCIDLVIPNGAGIGSAYVYYPFRGRLFEAKGVFTVQR